MKPHRNLDGRGAAVSPGVFGRRACFGCNGHKAELGGRVHPRNRQWHCAACAEKWTKKTT